MEKEELETVSAEAASDEVERKSGKRSSVS
jgi:hypothetical protein